MTKRGGKRTGAGRKTGSKNRPRFQLAIADEVAPKKPTPAARMIEQRRQVALLVADDMDEAVIAAVMVLTVDRLKAIFGHELRHGHAIVRAEVLARLNAAGAGGSVSADRALEAITAAAGSKSKLGKKDLANKIAARASISGNKFSTPAPPKILSAGERSQRAIDAVDEFDWQNGRALTSRVRN